MSGTDHRPLIPAASGSTAGAQALEDRLPAKSTVLLVEDGRTNLIPTRSTGTIGRGVALPFSSRLEVADRLPTLALPSSIIECLE